ncbi:MAG: hypothetical protein HC779_02060 [Phyllobacteriaceae bacterium]|nr:hypothetical protein [Phyllobacteriaceae bacterium]
MTVLDGLVAALVQDGRIALFALAILATEIIWFIWRGRISPRHARTVPTLFAGTFMMAALYLALSGGSTALLIVLLICSLWAHATDIYVRLFSDGTPQRPLIRGSSASRKPSPM